jgi:Holliday junction DNA helicase RuvA
MISRIKGELIQKGPSTAVVMCSGLGYEVDVSFFTGFDLPDIGGEVELFTHFVVREDVQSLFGFSREVERDLFRILIKINGVGPKLAMTILSSLDTVELVLCIKYGDVNTLVAVPGVGKKTAERLMIDLAGKVDHLSGVFEGSGSQKAKTASVNAACEESEEALVSLGYKPKEATKAIANVFEEGMTSQKLIRAALKNIMPKN